MKKFLPLLLLFTLPAHAADNAGLYAGLNLNYAHAQFQTSAPAITANGPALGTLIGYNYQFLSNLVLGVETDFQFASQKSSQAFPGFQLTERLNYFGTARARLGYALDSFMPYVTGGLAITNASIEASAPAGAFSDKTTRIGYAVGTGIDYMLSQNWVARAEYLYLDTGKKQTTLLGVTDNLRITNSVARLGLIYKFEP